jgi:hypothetical protein
MNRYQLWIVPLALAVGVAHASTLVGGSSNQELIGPTAPEFARTLQALRAADYSDRMNSTSWTANNPTLDHFYARKAASVEALIQQLQSGKPVSSGDIARALDNSQAQRFGGW